jgi:hypothetical protein
MAFVKQDLFLFCLFFKEFLSNVCFTEPGSTAVGNQKYRDLFGIPFWIKCDNSNTDYQDRWLSLCEMPHKTDGENGTNSVDIVTWRCFQRCDRIKGEAIIILITIL